jgi:hypothetical protein
MAKGKVLNDRIDAGDVRKLAEESRPRPKVPITLRALIQRINRKIAADGKRLRAARGRMADEFGAYYTVRDNVIVQTFRTTNDVVSYARDIGVLAAYEEVVP